MNLVLEACDGKSRESRPCVLRSVIGGGNKKYTLIAPRRQRAKGGTILNFFYDELSTFRAYRTQPISSTMKASTSISLLPAYTGRPLLVNSMLP